jgi:NhaP-type Na+/H+ or K+/H+ antiporter
MSEDIIKIEIDKDSVVELADFIESELKPPSRIRWILLYFTIGLIGGIGLGMFIGWLRG